MSVRSPPVICGKAVEQISVPFALAVLGRVCLSICSVDGVLIAPQEWAVLGVEWGSL